MASVRKREWTAPDGEKKTARVCEYTNKTTGKRHRETCKSKKDADAFRVKVEREVEAGTHIPDSETATIQKVTELYLLTCP